MESSKNHSEKKTHKKRGRRRHRLVKAPKLEKHMTFLNLMMNQLSMAFGTGTHEELVGRYRASATLEPTKFSLIKSFIHNTSRDFFGTEIQTMKFHSVSTNITGSSGSLTVVMRLRAADLAYFNSFSGIFDEYRFAGPITVHYRPTNVSATGVNGQIYGIGVIDFVDSTVLASVAGSLMYDTAKIFPLSVPYTGGLMTSWETKLLGNPDDLWIDTGSQATDVAWFKTYAYSGVSGSVAYGLSEWIAEVSFRQLYGI